jgi:seryl-tRNA synthetase
MLDIKVIRENPEKVNELLKRRNPELSIDEILEIGRKLVAEHYNSDYRIRTYSVRLLEFHIKYSELFADAIKAKAVGDYDTADALYKKMQEETGKCELGFQNCYDHGLAFTSLKSIFKTRTRDMGPIIY